jgi:hypothetical protein
MPSVGKRRALGVDGGGAAGEDEGGRPPRGDLVRAQPMADELGEDPRLAHAARDELAVLAAQVDDENGAVLGGRVRLGKGDDFRHQLRR